MSLEGPVWLTVTSGSENTLALPKERTAGTRTVQDAALGVLGCNLAHTLC